MPKCKHDPKRYYKGTEPSPKGNGYCAHSETFGKVRKGTDGNKWIVGKTKNGIQRWKRIKKNNIQRLKKIQKNTQRLKKTKKYSSTNKKKYCDNFVLYKKKPWNIFGKKYISGIQQPDGQIKTLESYSRFNKHSSQGPSEYTYHKINLDKKEINDYYCNEEKANFNEKYDAMYQTIDNGSPGYRVYVDPHNHKIEIWGLDESEVFWNDYDTYTDTFNRFVKKYSNTDGLFVGIDKNNSENLGNSLLLKLSKNKYAYIGVEVYEFKTKTPIVQYHSDIPEYDPYPYAIDENGLVYMMLEKRVWDGNIHNPNNKDPNDIYYNPDFFNSDVNSVNMKITKIIDQPWKRAQEMVEKF